MEGAGQLLANGWAAAKGPSSSLPRRGKKMKLETPNQLHFEFFFPVGKKEKKTKELKLSSERWVVE